MPFRRQGPAAWVTGEASMDPEWVAVDKEAAAAVVLVVVVEEEEEEEERDRKQGL